MLLFFKFEFAIMKNAFQKRFFFRFLSNSVGVQLIITYFDKFKNGMEEDLDDA